LKENLKMIKSRYIVISVALVAVVAAMVAAPARAAEQQSQLIAVLESDAPPAEKAITCKRLAIYGDKQAVDALAALLPNRELASWARIALEAIPDAEAGEALCEAMDDLDGRLLVGVINSIGVRREAKAVDQLAGRLKDADAQVASAAALALGRIAGPKATKALEQSLAGAPPKVRSAVAEGCVRSAEKLLAEGKAAEAAELYDKVRGADVPKQRVIEATRGAILARGADGVPLLMEQLRSLDKGLFRLGLGTARELPGSEVTEALVAELAQAAPERRALLILALADRNDPAALPAIVDATKSGPTVVRIAAVGVLPLVGDVSCVPALLDAASESDADLSQAAKTAVENLPGDGVDADLVARLGKAEGKMRPLLMELAGKRRIAVAVPLLLKAADDSDASIRAAALAALGSTVTADDLSVLIARVTSPKSAEDTEAVEKALLTACIRMPDREACAAQLVTAKSKAPTAVQCTLLEILGAMGGAKSLEALGAAALDASPELQDTSTRLLGEWMAIDAAPVLLDLAKTAPEEKYRIRSMRGYVRLARQFARSDKERVEMMRTALKTAQRDAEKQLIVRAMSDYPSMGMLRLAVEAAKTPSLKTDATIRAKAIAPKVRGPKEQVQKLLDQLNQ